MSDPQTGAGQPEPGDLPQPGQAPRASSQPQAEQTPLKPKPTPRQWLAAARPRTLPAAVVPVAVGIGTAIFIGHTAGPLIFWLRAVLALAVAVLLQLGVNYANDYSDGVRGTDDQRVGPVRLTGQGLAEPKLVRNVALSCFGAGALAGLVLTLMTGAWWLIAVGVVAILAGLLYTGGPKPYGYTAGGEVAVFIFFGLVAVTGTTFVLTDRFSWLALLPAVPVGLLACALLVINNLRDLGSDQGAGKRTLAVLLGDGRTRSFYQFCVVVPFLITATIGLMGIGFVAELPGGALLALIPAPLAFLALVLVRKGAVGRALNRVLALTGLVQLSYGLLLAVGVGLSA